ncbi:sequence-specific DNA binding transcription factor [Actinidia rufa]|uniref:Sequence-specific DNA binding transcription factor n=1 Tax=Actinidia rufa TaxID=165716 RepID=A0A7J0G5S6_9ERIC|nr:sequence-specific DNA binding transcription factor [Actinidia rufa]
MGEFTEFSTPQKAPSRPSPFREDFWTEEATSTLVDAWGRRYLDVNKGNLRQKDWREVADAVNARHGHTKKTTRTDTQCKNRIDTLKKKYKAEKARVSALNDAVSSPWPFFSRLDTLIGSAKKLPSPPPLAVPLVYWKPRVAQAAAVVLPHKRPFPAMDDSYAAAADESVKKLLLPMALPLPFQKLPCAAAMPQKGQFPVVDESYAEEEESDDLGTSEDDEEEDGEGMKRVARAIERFGEMYERVELEKQRQMVELEKQRMEFARDLEVQRMQLFMDTQVQLEKMKQGKRVGSDGERSVALEIIQAKMKAGLGGRSVAALLGMLYDYSVQEAVQSG